MQPMSEVVRGAPLATLVLLAGLAAGCGGGGGPGDGGVTDGGVTDGGADGGDVLVAPPAEPAEAAAPNIPPCPDGWRETSDDEGLASCEPWPEGGRAECETDEAHLPGADGCARVGPACPADGFPAAAPADALFVEQGASGGTGTRASPFGTVSAALSSANDGDVVAIAAGTYDEELVLTEAVTLLGACTGETLLTSSSASESSGVVSVSSDGVILESLRIGDSARPGVWVSGGGREVTLRDVVVTGATTVGVWVSGRSTVVGETLVVRGTRARSSGDLGWGLNAQNGATLTVRGGVVAENGEQGVVAVGDGTTVRLEDVALRDTRPASIDGMLGRGVAAFEGARVELVSSAVEGNTEAAVLAFDPGTEVRLERSVVRDTQPHPDGTFGCGLLADLGAHIETTRTVLERNTEWALQATESATVRLEDSIVRETRPIAGRGEAGYGANVLTEATLEAERVVFSSNTEFGVFSSDPGTSVSLVDVVIRDTQPRPSDGARGRGLTAQMGASIEGRRVRIERNAQYGVFSGDEGTSVSLEDVVVRDTRSDPTALGIGLGIGVQGGATATITRGRVEDSRLVGIYVTRHGSEVTLQDVTVVDTTAEAFHSGPGIGVHNGAMLSGMRVRVERNEQAGVFLEGAGGALRLEDLVVRDTKFCDCADVTGRGLNVQGGRAEIARALFERNREVQVYGYGEDTEISLQEVVVREVLERGCADTFCSDAPGGTGVTCDEGASCDLTRFTVQQSPLCGLQIGEGAGIDLSSGEVVGNSVGVCVQQPDYDVSRLQRDVIFRDNDINLESTTHAIPEQLGPLDLAP